MPIDPLALVKAARARHFAYKPDPFPQLTDAGYTPTTQVGRNPIDNPAADATQRLQGHAPSNAAALAARFRPQNPTNPVEPNANGIPLPNFAEGGQVLSKVSKLLADAIAQNAPTVARKEAPNVLAQKLRAGFVDPKELNHLMYADPSATKLINAYQTAVDNGAVTSDLRDALANKLDSMGTTPPPQVQQFAPVQPKPQAGPVQPNTQLNSPMMQQTMNPTPPAMAGGGTIYGTSPLAREIEATPPNPPIIQRGSSAQGGSSSKGDGTSESSLKWIADMARKMGVPSMAEDRARVATGIAKQFYGLDENGNPVLGGKAWTSSQHGTPPRILDELTSIPGSMSHLLTAINPEPKDVASQPGHDPTHTIGWSDDAGARLDQLDKRVKDVTGVGDAQTLPQHIEDAAGMLATPIPAAKVAKEAPMLQRALEYLTPVRPPTLTRYATDSGLMGGANAGIDEIAKRLAARKAAQTTTDPGIEDIAMENANAQ